MLNSEESYGSENFQELEEKGKLSARNMVLGDQITSAQQDLVNYYICLICFKIVKNP